MAKLSAQLRAFFTWIVQPAPLLAVLCSSLFPIFLVRSVYIIGQNIPTMDDWWVSVPTAVHASEGTLTFSELVGQFGAQRPVFTRLLTAFLSYTTDWNLHTEQDISILLNAVCLLLLIDLVRLRQRQVVPVILVLFSALFFSLKQWYSLLLVLTTHTHIVNAFFVLALWVLARFRIGWRALISAGVLSFCATFSYGVGMVTWPVFAVTLWMLGYRKWRFYVFWAVAAALSLALFFTGYTQLATRPALARFVLFFTAGLANPISSHVAEAVVTTLIGLLLLVANGYVIWQRQRDWSQVAVWTALAGYSTASMLIITVGRALENVEYRELNSRYTATITPLWVAVIAVTVIATWQMLEDDRRQRVTTLLVRGNLVFLVVLAGQYLDMFGRSWKPDPRLTASQILCYQAYPLARDSSCLEGIGPYLARTNPAPALMEKLAQYRKTAYAQAVAVLPADFQAGDRVVIDAPLAYQHDPVAYRTPGGKRVAVPNADQFHIVSADQRAGLKRLPEKPAHLALEADPAAMAQFEAFVDGAERVWYLRTVDPAPFGDVFMDALSARYAQHYVQAESELLYPVIAEFQPLPDEVTLHELFRFDGALTLREWRLPDGVQVKACQNVTLKSWWSVTGALDTAYGMALVLSDSGGMGVSRVEQPPAFYQTPQLVPGRLYLDIRTLTIPCDAEAGDYPLLVTLYRFSSDYSATTPVIATGSDGTPVGEYVYLTTLTIR